MEKVGVEGFADYEQELCVNRWFVEQFLQCPWCHAYLLCQPRIGVALTTEFFADKVAYVYLHSGCHLCVWLPIPCCVSDDRKIKKRRRADFVSCLRS